MMELSAEAIDAGQGLLVRKERKANHLRMEIDLLKSDLADTKRPLSPDQRRRFQAKLKIKERELVKLEASIATSAQIFRKN